MEGCLERNVARDARLRFAPRGELWVVSVCFGADVSTTASPCTLSGAVTAGDWSRRSTFFLRAPSRSRRLEIHVFGVANAPEEEAKVAAALERDEALVFSLGNQRAQKHEVEELGALASAERRASMHKINT